MTMNLITISDRQHILVHSSRRTFCARSQLSPDGGVCPQEFVGDRGLQPEGNPERVDEHGERAHRRVGGRHPDSCTEVAQACDLRFQIEDP